MANLNKVLLIGNLTRDPELRYSGGGQGGTAITKFGLATNRQWRNQSGEQQEDTCFVDITVFGRQAETCYEYLSKGRPVFIEGRLSFSSWEDRETGARRSKLEVIGERVQFLGSRGDGGGSGIRYPDRSHGEQPQPRQAPVPASGPASGRSDGGGTAQAKLDYDDIPF